MDKHVIVVGSIEGGFEIYGPFNTPDDAFRFAKTNGKEDAEIIPLRSRQDFVDTFNS